MIADVDGPTFRTAVLDWYDRKGRRLPFRGTTDPYLVFVSESILQQTQVARGGPAWAAFTARFPTVEALAQASPADVLRAWRGLGYNRRAINLSERPGSWSASSAAGFRATSPGWNDCRASDRTPPGPWPRLPLACRSVRSTRTSDASSDGSQPVNRGRSGHATSRRWPMSSPRSIGRATGLTP